MGLLPMPLTYKLQECENEVRNLSDANEIFGPKPFLPHHPAFVFRVCNKGAVSPYFYFLFLFFILKVLICSARGRALYGHQCRRIPMERCHPCVLGHEPIGPCEGRVSLCMSVNTQAVHTRHSNIHIPYEDQSHAYIHIRTATKGAFPETFSNRAV